MKILLVTPSYGVYGGIEAFVLALADWLRLHSSHEIRVCFKSVSGTDPSDTLVSRCHDLGIPAHFVAR